MKKYYGIEILRFFTSLSVLFYHYRHFFGPYNSTSNLNYPDISSTLPFYKFLNLIYDHGIFGVHVFYTISGFVFAYIYLQDEEKIKAKEFFINRFARLYPLHFATLLLVLFLQTISYINFDSSQIIENNDAFHFILHLFFISSWGFENGHSFNAPIWSVSIEVAIYIIFFLTLSIIKKYKIFSVIVLSIFLLIIDKVKIYDTLFLECARLFFSGTLVYYLTKLKIKEIIFIALSTFLVMFSFMGNFKTFVFCPGLVLFFVSIEKYILDKKIQKYFRDLGNLTYSLYLLHLPVQILILIIFKLMNFSETIFVTNYFFFAFFIFLIFISNYSFRLYEKRLNDLIRKKFKEY